jgi:hypothetical protein
MVWRGLYTIPDDTLATMVVGWTVFLAELYGLFKFGFFAYSGVVPSRPHHSSHDVHSHCRCDGDGGP